MRGKNITKEEDKLMQKLYAEGKTQKQIAEMLGRSQNTVCYHVNKAVPPIRCNYNYAYYRINRCGGKHMKMVVFRRNGYLYMTNEENYNAMIEDAHKVTSLKYFDSFDQVVDYMVRYTGSPRDKFIDRTGDAK